MVILGALGDSGPGAGQTRSEEHTSELQSQSNLVCRLLLEKKKNPSRAPSPRPPPPPPPPARPRPAHPPPPAPRRPSPPPSLPRTHTSPTLHTSQPPHTRPR